MPTYAIHRTATVNVRVLSALSRFAGNDDRRYYLQGVKLEIEPRAVTYAATDGHVLLSHREERFVDEEPDNDLVGEFIIPTAQCKFFKCKKDDLGHAELLLNEHEMVLRRGALGVVFNPIDGTFPNWRRTIPKLPLAQGIGQFNGDYLAKFKKAGDDLSLGPPFLAHNGHDAPALVRFSTAETIGVIVPFRSSDGRMTPLPAWIERQQAAE